MQSLRSRPFPEAGDGCEIVFRNSDLLAIQKQYGPGYLEAIEKGLLNYDLDIIDACIKVCIKKGGVPHKVDLDYFDAITVDDLASKILDAYSLSANGRTFAEQVKWRTEQIEKLSKDMESRNASSPLLSPVDSSAVSSETPAGPGSEMPSSGN